MLVLSWPCSLPSIKSSPQEDKRTNVLVGEEGRVERREVVEDAAQGPHVGGGGVGPLEIDLGADEVRGAHLRLWGLVDSGFWVVGMYMYVVGQTVMDDTGHNVAGMDALLNGV